MKPIAWFALLGILAMVVVAIAVSFSSDTKPETNIDDADDDDDDDDAEENRADGEPVDCIQKAGDWSVCLPSDGVCGEGVQSRTTRITQRPNAYGKECRPEYEEQNCYVACSSGGSGGDAGGYENENVDCVSTSGSFGECSASCGPGFKQRQVNVIVQPRGFGTACPPETIPCNERDCAVLDEDDMFDEESSSETGIDPQPPVVGNLDCVSELTPEWSACSEQVCGKGRQYKTRVVKVPERGSGRPCAGIGERVYQDCAAAPGRPGWTCERTPILSGNDVGAKSGATEQACATACSANVQCVGFSYEDNTCYLKSVAQDSTRGKMFYTRLDASGRPMAADSSHSCVSVPGYACAQTPVYSGSDDTSYEGKTLNECKALCEGRSTCIGFSHAGDGKCWFKTAKFDTTSNKRFYTKL